MRGLLKWGICLVGKQSPYVRRSPLGAGGNNADGVISPSVRAGTAARVRMARLFARPDALGAGGKWRLSPVVNGRCACERATSAVARAAPLSRPAAQRFVVLGEDRDARGGQRVDGGESSAAESVEGSYCGETRRRWANGEASYLI